MTRSLDNIISDYKNLTNNNNFEYANNKILKEIQDFYYGFKFLKKYFTDPKIKKLKEEYTEAIHEDLVNNHNYNHNFASKLAKAIPMPAQNRISKAIIAILLGFTMGRIHEENVDLITKYAGLTKKGYLYGCTFAEAINNPFSAFQNGVAAWTLDYVINETYSLMTNDNSRIFNVQKYYPYLYGAAIYIDTIKTTIKMKRTGIYDHNKFMPTRLPSVFTWFASYQHRKFITKQSQSQHKSYKHEEHADHT